jgi:hypothetical protein
MCCLLAGLLCAGYLLLMELRDGGPELVLATGLRRSLIGGGAERLDDPAKDRGALCHLLHGTGINARVSEARS